MKHLVYSFKCSKMHMVTDCIRTYVNTISYSGCDVHLYLILTFKLPHLNRSFARFIVNSNKKTNKF